jgi:hypothetical protein
MSKADEQLEEIETLMRKMGFKEDDVEQMRNRLHQARKKSLQLEQKAQILNLVQNFLQKELVPIYVRDEEVSDKFPYPIALRVEWRKNSLYFVKQLRDPRNGEIFEYDYAKMSLKAGQQFNIAYHRHTGQYLILYHELSLDASLEALRKDILLQP